MFVNSMNDLFHARVPLSFVRQVFAVIADTPQHTYQILTKRSGRLPKIAAKLDWPPNLWMGVSVEDRGALFRADHLRAVPATVRFLSLEPLLGPLPDLDLTGIEWVIVGGESGRGYRPVHPDWIRDLRDQSVCQGTAFFFKLLCTTAIDEPLSVFPRQKLGSAMGPVTSNSIGVSARAISYYFKSQANCLHDGLESGRVRWLDKLALIAVGKEDQLVFQLFVLVDGVG